jgi:hypothetical protein
MMRLQSANVSGKKVRATQRPNLPVNADARDVPAHASDRAARAGYRARYSA